MGHRVKFNEESDFAVGGLVSNVDVEFRDCAWEVYDYEGKSENPAIALGANLHIINPDKTVQEEVAGGRRQYWSAGDGSKFLPVEDGRYLEAEDEHAKLSASSNYAFFAKQHIQLGFKLPDSDATRYNGLQAHVVRVPAPERSGLAVSAPVGEDGKTRSKEILVISKIIAKPSDTKVSTVKKTPPRGIASSTAPAAAKTAPATPETTQINPETTAENVVGYLLGDDPSAFSSTRADFTKKALQAMTTTGPHVIRVATTRNQILAFIKDDEWLNNILSSYGLGTDGENIGPVE